MNFLFFMGSRKSFYYYDFLPVIFILSEDEFIVSIELGTAEKKIIGFSKQNLVSKSLIKFTLDSVNLYILLNR